MNQKFTVTFDPNKIVAIIYQADGLYAYLVEIRKGNDSYFISENDKPLTFGNMEDARAAALKAHAEIAYLALTKTSEEVDLTTCHKNQDKYDYSEVPLGKK